MNVEMKIISDPDPKKTRRDPGAITFSEPPPGDCTVKCPSCDFVLEEDVSADYVRKFSSFTCPACSAVSRPTI